MFPLMLKEQVGIEYESTCYIITYAYKVQGLNKRKQTLSQPDDNITDSKLMLIYIR